MDLGSWTCTDRVQIPPMTVLPTKPVQAGFHSLPLILRA